MLQIEPGKRLGVQAVTMAKIAQVLHVSTDYLLGLKEEPEPMEKVEQEA